MHDGSEMAHETSADDGKPVTSTMSAPEEHRKAGAGRWLAVVFRLQPVLLALFFLAIGAALTTPVTDPDFWWHLASGRLIWERGTLLRADPFAFTTASFPPTVTGAYLFTQYWLAELLIYGIHSVFGLAGVIILRAAAFAAMFMLLYRLLRSLGAGVLPAVLLVALASRVIVHELGYIGDRPQMWSSLFFVAALLLCQRQREGWGPAFIGLPLLMLLWANLHGGYPIGLIVVGFSAAAAAIAGSATRKMWVSAAAALVLCGCNPAGYSVLLSYPANRMGAAEVVQGIVEESPLLTWVGLTSLPRLFPALAAILALSLLALLPRIRGNARERPDLLALYVLTLAMSVASVRFTVFFVVAAAALAAFSAAALMRGRWATLVGRFPLIGQPGAVAGVTAVVLIALAAQQAGCAARASALRPGAAFRHPYEGVADFLQGSGLTGNLLNEYGAGGYLTWRLFPSLQVFIYGRTLSKDLFVLYEDLLMRPSAAQGGRPRYQAVLDAHRIDTLVLPSCNPATGLILPLTVLVARDEHWALVYSDTTAVVLVRKAAAPDRLIANAPPPTVLYDNMIAIAESAGRSRHGQVMPGWRYSLAFALYGKGERAAALAVLDEYLQLAPDHAAARRMQERIRREIEAAGEPASPAWVDEEAPGLRRER